MSFLSVRLNDLESYREEVTDMIKSKAKAVAMRVFLLRNSEFYPSFDLQNLARQFEIDDVKQVIAKLIVQENMRGTLKKDSVVI